LLRHKSVILLLTVAAVSSKATEIQLSYNVLERLIAQQVFTDDGRKYVKGSKADKCTFAYLENPRISGASGRVVIKAKFTGRSAIDMFGRCVGLGDAFNLTVIGLPFYEKGRIAFKDISVETDRDGFYIRRVRQALVQSLSKQFDYQIQNDAKRLLEQQSEQNPLFKRQMMKFDVTQIQAADKALILTVDFILAVQ
jgi:hypothetical protein